MNGYRFRRWSALPGAVALVLAVAGCGSGSPSGDASAPHSTHSVSPHTSSSTAHASSSAAPAGTSVPAVKSAFVNFFSGKTPADRKVTLVQRGHAFSDVIHKQAGGTMSQATTVKVLHITLDSPDSATVRYTILLGGQPALKNQTGSAVKEHGSWKVASATFCQLLELEQSAPPLCSSTS